MINEKRMMIEALNIANVDISSHRKIVSAKRRIFNDIAAGVKETFKGEVGTDIFADLLLATLYCFKNTAEQHKLSYLISRATGQLEAEVAWARVSNKMKNKADTKHLINFVRTLNEKHAKNLKLSTNTKFNLIKLLNKIDPSKLSSKNPMRNLLSSKNWNDFGAGIAKDVMTVRGLLFAALLSFFEAHENYEVAIDGHGTYTVKKLTGTNVEVQNYMFKTPRQLSDVHAFKFDLTSSIQRQSIAVSLSSAFTFNEDYNNAIQEVIKSKEHWNYFSAENEEALVAKVETVELDVNNGLRFWEELGKGNVYFNYVIDFRGRISQLGGLSAVGHKVGKAMLRSGTKQRLGAHGFKHILLNLAGSMGHDKMVFADRLDWANENLDTYIEIGNLVITNPVQAFRELHVLKADDIFSAAAISLELYYISKTEGEIEDFESNLFVGYDATCSGLQIVSLLWGNQMLAENTNVARFENTEDKIYDIYKYLYEAMDKIVWDGFTTDIEYSEELLEVWDALNLKVKRGIAKVLLMPRIYGSTFQTWAKNTRKEAGKKDIFAHVEDEGLRAKMVFNFGTVVAQLFQATFDNESGFQAFRDFDAVVSQIASAYNSKQMDTVWTLHEPSTFDDHKIKSVYRVNATARYRAYYAGQMIRATSYGTSIFEDQLQAVSKVNTKKADKRKAKNAISPNFVHSLDALLLHTVNYIMKSSMRLTHDCFACTAGNAERLMETINNTFIDLFSGRNNIIEKLVEETKANTGIEITIPDTLIASGIGVDNIQKGAYKFS